MHSALSLEPITEVDVMNSESSFQSSEALVDSTADLSSNANRMTPVEAEYQALWQYFSSNSLAAERQYATNQTYAIRILELFLLTGVVAIGLTLIRNFDTVGSLAIFLSASLFSILSSWLTSDANRVRFWNQMLWGIVVPVAAVIGDPVVFGTYKGGVPISVQDFCFGFYFVLGYSMLLLALSWFLKPTSFPWVNALVAGQLRCGAAVLILVGLVLIPITLFGLFFLFGLLGLVPWITGGIYFRTSALHYRWAKSQAESEMRATFIFGFMIVLLTFVVLSILGVTGFFREFLAY
jgi:hypothetical protein